MSDIDLAKAFEYLQKLERRLDTWADTPKRHKASEHIVAIRKLLKEPTTPGYER